MILGWYLDLVLGWCLVLLHGVFVKSSTGDCQEIQPQSLFSSSNPTVTILRTKKKQKVSYLIHPRHISRAEVATVVCLFLLSLPASVALFLTSFCLGSLWGLLWRWASLPQTSPNPPIPQSTRRFQMMNLLNKQAKQSMTITTTCIIYIYIYICGWVQYTSTI